MAKLRVDKIAASGQITENTGSVFFDGTSDWLRARGGDNFNDFNFGSSDFTIEGFFYANDVNGTDIPIALAADTVSANSDAGWYIRYQSNKIEGKAYSGSSEIGATQSGTVSNNTWYHVAYVREGSTFTLYVDGVAVSTATSSDSLNWNSGWKVEIGSGYGGANYFAGYISNLRICKGHAVYKSNFAPPTRELEVHQGPDDDRTVLLACHDGENIFADKTGRHILASQGNRTSSPTLAAGETPVGITTFNPGLTRSVDATAGPTFQGGVGFVSQNWLTLPKGTTTDRNLCGTRGLFAGSNPQPGDTGGNTIEFITVSTTGNTQDFGDRIGKGRRAIAAMSGSTRAVFAGSYGPSSTIADTIDYVNIATTGNAVDFGNCLSDLTEATGISNSTRGIIAGGRTPTVSNVMQYVTIPTLGNAIDFGDLSVAKRNAGSFQSSTRGVVAGGRNPSGTDLNVIEYVTIASTGNAVDFGDISSGGGQNNMGGSNSTRGLVAGGNPSTNTITYVTISTLGNSVDFGDNTAATHGMNTMATSPTRACMFGAATPARTLSYVEIATTGNALDFGSFGIDATTGYSSGCSNGHGGIS